LVTKSEVDANEEKPIAFQLMQALALLLISTGLATATLDQNATAPLTLEKTIPLEGVTGRIDHMAVDVPGQRLFVAALANNTVEVVDLKAGKRIQSLSGFAEPQGIAYVQKTDRIFVANGQDGTCRMIDGRSLKTLSSVQCGNDADNVRYDEKAGRIYVGYGGGALGVLDVQTGSKLTDIKLAGHPESFRLETMGARIFVNVPQADHIAIVDREKGQVVQIWPLKNAKSNFPVFLDEANHRLFVGCRSPATLLVYDTTAPVDRIVATLPINGDTDDLFYDPSSKLIYVSCGQGVIDVVRQVDPDHYTLDKSVKTSAGARTSLFVPELKILCLAMPHRGSQPAEIRVLKTP
jgi:DNA-binding beta-propeller fold protein YncE